MRADDNCQKERYYKRLLCVLVCVSLLFVDCGNKNADSDATGSLPSDGDLEQALTELPAALIGISGGVIR